MRTAAVRTSSKTFSPPSLRESTPSPALSTGAHFLYQSCWHGALLALGIGQHLTAGDDVRGAATLPCCPALLHETARCKAGVQSTLSTQVLPCLAAMHLSDVRPVWQRSLRTEFACRDEPTIMAWELMNEPRCPGDFSASKLQHWIERTAEFLKSVDPTHLIAVGSEGFFGSSTPGEATFHRAGLTAHIACACYQPMLYISYASY